MLPVHHVKFSVDAIILLHVIGGGLYRSSAVYCGDAVWLLGLFSTSLSSFYIIMDLNEIKSLTFLCPSMTI